MTTFSLPRLGFAFFWIERRCFKDNALLCARLYGRDIGIRSDVDAFGFEIVGPFTVELLKMWEGDHVWQIGKEGLRIVVPQLHVWVIEKALEDCAGYIGCLVA